MLSDLALALFSELPIQDAVLASMTMNNQLLRGSTRGTTDTVERTTPSASESLSDLAQQSAAISSTSPSAAAAATASTSSHPLTPEGSKLQSKMPHIPTEIHLQILSHLLPQSPFPNGCGFCLLFSLHDLLFVSPTYAFLITQYIYKSLPLNFSTQTSVDDPHTHCQIHHRLSSKRQQLHDRLPLLLRTLRERPDLARSVKRIYLPAAIHTYLTCSLEKVLLPELLTLCQNVEEIQGMESLLERQFYNGEHFCLDGDETAQHGILAKTVVGMKNLKRWKWRGGSVVGVWANVLDGHPDMKGYDFQKMHVNWSRLEELSLDVFWPTTPVRPRDSHVLFEHLPKLRKLRIGSDHFSCLRGYGLRELLDTVPSSVRVLELDGLKDVSTLCEWLYHNGQASNNGDSLLDELQLTLATADVDSVIAICRSLMSEKECQVGPYGEQQKIYRSSVRRLKVDNSGWERATTEFPSTSMPTPDSSMELRGLDELSFGVYATLPFDDNHHQPSEVDNHMCPILWLATALEAGWFKDLNKLEIRVATGGIGQLMWKRLMQSAETRRAAVVLQEDPGLDKQGRQCPVCSI